MKTAMKAPDFADLCRRVFGRGWHRKAANLLGCTERQIYNYQNGHSAIPESHVETLRRLGRTRPTVEPPDGRDRHRFD